MNINKIDSPEDVYTWIDKNISYGWKDVNGNQHSCGMKGFRKLYRTMSIEETLTCKIGTCIEQAALIHDLLDRINVPNKMFCCRVFEPDDYKSPEEEGYMHCFVLFFRSGKTYHLEHPAEKNKGIHKYASEEEAVKAITDHYVALHGGKESPTTQFFELPAGMTFQEFNAFINHQVQYRSLRADEINRELFRDFIRRQVVTKCRRRENGAWVVREDPFIDDWTEEDYEVLVTCLQNTIAAGGFVYAAFVEHKMKGFVSVEPELFGGEQRYLDLSSIHVSEDVRGRKIGKELFLAAKWWAAEHGAGKLYISAHSAIESQEFYKKMGCVEAAVYHQGHVEKEPYDCQLECLLCFNETSAYQ